MSVDLLAAFVATTFSGTVFFSDVPIAVLENFEEGKQNKIINTGIYICTNGYTLNITKTSIKEIQGMSQNFIYQFISDNFGTTKPDNIFQYRINGYDANLIRPIYDNNLNSFAVYTKINDQIYDLRRIYFTKEDEFFYIDKNIPENMYKDVYKMGNGLKLNIQIVDQYRVRFPFNLTWDKDPLSAMGQVFKITDFSVLLDSYIKDNNFKNGRIVTCKL